ncbi:5-formyltetrahydrofolate cyclo-ligase [Novipirellula artificiosorum]|uniref:5-formyltetrahydrofolate cyclo-ligase n=1 Tax=Novipirellula artificiosorum TaxID=2528016 RepID=A0A5C6D4N4_9BACT|nr:5-formyltetrahydrofolate cyclo-ligase [Novipirellula artificiosorum]TWU31025.1 5-formyltetrahydrofolate cyclo-ligase family protein [Novipirellula artificiosorum]
MNQTNPPSGDSIVVRKRDLRRTAELARRGQTDKDTLSQQITDRVVKLPEYAQADCVMWYVDTDAEVRTQHVLADAIESKKRVVVPYCEVVNWIDQQLALFHLQSMDELAIGKYGVLEPKRELRTLASKQVDVKQLGVILVPGVAFDRRGGRIGHGMGYYDKLLANANQQTPLISLAFECQMFDEVPIQPHDIFMDKVVTEVGVYDGIGRPRS